MLQRRILLRPVRGLFGVGEGFYKMTDDIFTCDYSDKAILVVDHGDEILVQGKL